MEDVNFRQAQIKDIEQLAKIERACFSYDALSEKNFKHIIAKANADVLVYELEGKIAGYGILFYRRGTSLCRLYSLGVSPNFQGRGIGQKLLARLEQSAQSNDMTYMRLEVKKDNTAAIALYEKVGFVPFMIKHDYYEDHSDALCMEKRVQKVDKSAIRVKLPFYRQTTDFTCGPASLMMAMKSLDPKRKNDRNEEIQIWREATTIFMTSGHGGCGPHGLALAAHKRGFGCELYLNTDEYLFVDGVRQKEKKDIIKLTQDNFLRQIKKNKIPISHKLGWQYLEKILKRGGVPLVLISSYRLTNSKVPHWIAITGMSKDFVFFNDPYIEKEDTIVTNTDIPIRKDEFETMAKYGSKQIKSLVAIFAPQ